MSFSENTQAILLLNDPFTSSDKGSVQPLSPVEWGALRSG